MKAREDELMKEVRALKLELKEIRDAMNMLLSVVMEEREEDGGTYPPRAARHIQFMHPN